MNVTDYCADLGEIKQNSAPWELLLQLEDIIRQQLGRLGDGYIIKNEVAIHKTAKVDTMATIKGPTIIGPGCFIGAHTLLRGGIYLVESVSIGPSCEVKHSVIGKNTAFAHFNFVGDSVVGSRVNMEAGAVVANHFNERDDKTIFVVIDGVKTALGIDKFGAIIGDETKIGANAVTSPGTILVKNSMVGRLELVEQA